jgi:hypothetical protein
VGVQVRASYRGCDRRAAGCCPNATSRGTMPSCQVRHTAFDHAASCQTVVNLEAINHCLYKITSLHVVNMYIASLLLQSKDPPCHHVLDYHRKCPSALLHTTLKIPTPSCCCLILSLQIGPNIHAVVMPNAKNRADESGYIASRSIRRIVTENERNEVESHMT